MSKVYSVPKGTYHTTPTPPLEIRYAAKADKNIVCKPPGLYAGPLAKYMGNETYQPPKAEATSAPFFYLH